MNQGWIKLHRRLLDNPIVFKPEWAWLWVTLLLMANHEEKEFIWNGKKQTCKRGQLLTGRDALAKQTGIHRSSVERALDYLESEHQIEQQKNNRFRLITIVKYEQYQIKEHQIEQPVSNKRATSEQPVSTNKNVKKDKNDNNTGRGKILKELRRYEDIGNPEAYLRSIESKCSPEAIAQAWSDWKRGSGVESPAEFYNRCLHYSQ